MIFKDYYKILGLETNKVTIEQIKNAFRDQAKKYHPDVNSGSIAEERFKDINEAYRTLSTPNLKRKYDRIWYSHVGKRIEKQKEEREAKPDFFTLLFGNFKFFKKQEKRKIPEKGENVEGKPGINGGNSGDLFIKINIENTKKYRLYGYDIYTDLYITPWEAVLGAKVTIEGIDGTNNIYIPQGMRSGEKIKIPKKGYKDGKGGRGDLFAEIKIVVPKQLTEEEIEIYKKLKEISKFEPRNQEININ